MPKPLVTSLAAVLILSGCGASGAGSSSPSTGTAAAPTTAAKAGPACAALTAGIARSLFGGPAHRTRKARLNPHMTACTYNSAQGSASISVIRGDWPSIKQFEISGKTKAIHGVGQQAYSTSTGVVARKGGEGIAVTAFQASGSFSGAAATKVNAANLAFERKVAKRVLTRL